MPRKKTEGEKAMNVPGFSKNIAVSVMSFFSLIAFLILWLFLFAGSFSIYQNIAVVIAAIIVFVAVMAASWISWGIRYEQKYGKGKEARWDGKAASCCNHGFAGMGMKCHGTSGCIYGLGFLGSLIYYVSTATDFWSALFGVIKALLWPAFLTFGVLKFIGA
jgi:hypothetical protein